MGRSNRFFTFMKFACRVTVVVFVLVIGISFYPGAVLAQIHNGIWNENVEKRANELISQMTMDEKIKMLSGTSDEMHVPGVPRLNIPELKFSDGPVGMRCYGPSTAYPCGAMLAASWDRDLAKQYGQAIGHDCLTQGVHVILAPGVDLYRQAQCGRNFEYFGEDPYLSAQMAVNYVLGVQGQHVAVSVKHYAANDQETLRDSVNTIVSERRLHEICLPPFKAAVEDGHAWTLMAAYNKLNGFWCTANKELLTDILRKQWGFKGVLMSDWGAVHEFLGPFTAGTDLEMGVTKYYTAENIKHALEEKKITQEELDEHVRRILRMSIALGFLDNPQKLGPANEKDPSSGEVALRVAREGLTLLKNQDGFLPLNRSVMKNVVVMGVNGCPAVTGGGGSSQTEPKSAVSLFDAITSSAAKDANVQFIPPCPDGNPTGRQAFEYKGVYEPTDGVRCVEAAYTNDNGTQGVIQRELAPSHWWGKGHPADAIKTVQFSARYKAKIKAAQTDDYVFAISTDGATVSLDGKPILDVHQPGLGQQSTRIHLLRGEVHDLSIEYRHSSKGDAIMQFTWGKATSDLTPAEMEAIRNADAVVYAAGYNQGLEGEGFDRTYDLPANQVAEIKNLTRLNKRVLVVLNAGGNVGMQDWVDSVQGLMHAWYPGENGNQAVAEAIFGDLNPSGHLPDTFEKRWEDSPSFTNYPGDSANGGTVKYDEGIFVGYRWYDRKNIAPRYPFGYGLSYTTFAIHDLQIEKPAGAEREWHVTATVTNTGSVRGACVAQLYVRPINSTVDRPVQELKEFLRPELDPGKSKFIGFTLKKDAFGTYDETKHAWIYPPGQYEIALGTSSRDIHCSNTITVDARQLTAAHPTRSAGNTRSE